MDAKRCLEDSSKDSREESKGKSMSSDAVQSEEKRTKTSAASKTVPKDNESKDEKEGQVSPSIQDETNVHTNVGKPLENAPKEIDFNLLQRFQSSTDSKKSKHVTFADSTRIARFNPSQKVKNSLRRRRTGSLNDSLEFKDNLHLSSSFEILTSRQDETLKSHSQDVHSDETRLPEIDGEDISTRVQSNIEGKPQVPSKNFLPQSTDFSLRPHRNSSIGSKLVTEEETASTGRFEGPPKLEQWAGPAYDPCPSSPYREDSDRLGGDPNESYEASEAETSLLGLSMEDSQCEIDAPDLNESGTEDMLLKHKHAKVKDRKRDSY